MAYFVEPGHIAMVMLTPEQYMRMYHARSPSMWPVYFGARMAAQTIQDLLMKKMQTEDIGLLKKNLDLMLGFDFGAAYRQQAGGPTGDVGALKASIKNIMGGLYDNWRAGIWRGVGGAYSSAMDNLIASGQLIYAYKVLAYHTAVTPRMRRHWNRTFTPMVPTASMAYILYRRGRFNYADFVTHASYDGWDKEGADQLLAAMELLPSPREAFYLWKKNQIGTAERNAYYLAGGYDSRYHNMITENWYRVPSFYDLMRLADYIELDQIWTVMQLRKGGWKDTDIGKIWPALRDRPVRDEIRAITSKWLWRHQHGRATLDMLSDVFMDLGIRVRERELLLYKAEMDYEDELVDEMAEILRWRFRGGAITDKEYMEGLMVDCGIREPKANLIVDLEKAKGYTGYY